MLLIKNGYIFDPLSGRKGIYDILIENDKIKQTIYVFGNIFDD